VVAAAARGVACAARSGPFTAASSSNPSLSKALWRQVQSQRADERDSSRKGGAASASAAGRARCLWKTGGAECGRMDAAGSDHSSGSLLRAEKQQFLDLKWVQGYDLLALPAEPPTPPLSLPGASTSQASAADSFNDLAARAAA